MLQDWLFNKFFKNIDRTAIIKNSVIAQNVKVGAFTRNINSRISGRVEIKDNGFINDAKIHGSIKIGRRTSVNYPNTDIYARVETVTVGNFCSIARCVAIQEYDHHWDRCTSYMIQQNVFKGNIRQDIISKRPVTIGHDVWIGTQSAILSGVNIGNGAIVSANSTLTGDVPAYAIVAGNPARVLRYRFDGEVIEMLGDLEWWPWNDEKLNVNKALFSGPVTTNKLNNILQ